MRETPQELVGIKQRQNTTEASSKHRRDWIHISQVFQEYPPGSFSELFPSKQKAFNSGDRQILLGIKDWENIAARQKSNMVLHGSRDPQPGLHLLSQAWTFPLTLSRSPGSLPESKSNPAGPPREKKPKPTAKNIRHLLQKLHSRWCEGGGLLCTWNWGRKNRLWGTCTLSQAWNGSKAFCSGSKEKLICLEMCLYVPAITQPA